MKLFLQRVFWVGLMAMCAGRRATAQEAAPVPSTFTQTDPATEKPAWQAALEKRRIALITRNGSGTNKELAAQLMVLQAADQQARGIVRGTPSSEDKTTAALSLNEADAQDTEALKAIVAKDGWPTIALVGIEASNAAMLLLTHTRDHAWQASMLEQLEQLADQGKIDGSALAGVIDKELIGEGQLQRYGTQFKYIDGAMWMYSVEDPGGLDARRAQVFLPPLAVYKQQLEAMYHLKATDKMVMAARPVAQAPAK